MRSCDNGQMKLVTAVVLAVDVPPAAPVIVTARPVTVSHAEPVLSFEDRTIPPEKPPF
ncbi:hypothetical protein D3C83_114180 [compost metagenome]